MEMPGSVRISISGWLDSLGQSIDKGGDSCILFARNLQWQSSIMFQPVMVRLFYISVFIIDLHKVVQCFAENCAVLFPAERIQRS